MIRIPKQENRTISFQENFLEIKYYLKLYIKTTYCIPENTDPEQSLLSHILVNYDFK